VQDGCDYTCSFCTIPLARGHSRSDRIANVLRNVAELAATNTKEIVLTGINLGDFGKGNTGGKNKEENFLELITELDKSDGIERFRISSIEPNLLTNEIIDFVANSKKFMPHFHIPLQSGSDSILGKMRRRYRTDLYTERIQYIKSRIPHCCIGVDVIVGFPSESEEDFRNTFNYLLELDISYLHVFTYSERNETQALDIKPVVPIHVRNERNKQLRHLSFRKMKAFETQHEGTTRKVLFESANKNGFMEGYTDNYIKVQAPYRTEWINSILDWKI
jgi:threonylcarbamoyladenosine tRNA methylthiotransferase MtaB